MTVDEIIAKLSKPQKMGLLDLTKDGYVHKGLWELSRRGYRQLLDMKLIVEVWTWLDYTRPSVGLTDLGGEVQDALILLGKVK